MDIQLKQYTNYNDEEILRLYKSVGWSLYVDKPGLLKEAFKYSLYILGAYVEGELVGLVRVVGDGVTIVFIQDLVVHGSYHRLGIGTKLMLAVLEKYEGVRQKALLTDDFYPQKSFYRSLGLKPISETKGVCFVKYTF